MTVWPTAPIGELCKLVNGCAFKPSDWTKLGLPIVRIQNLNDSGKPFNRYSHPVNPRFLLDSGDILLSWSGTPGTSFGCFLWNRGPAILNQHIFRVHVNTGRMCEKFFIYGVNSRLDEMIRLAHGGVGLRHITKGKLQAIRLPVPPRSEQRRIVKVIDSCMKKINEIHTLRSDVIVKASLLLTSILNDMERGHDWPRIPIRDVLKGTRNGRSVSASSAEYNGRVLTLTAVRGVNLDLDAYKDVWLEQNMISQISSVHPRCFRISFEYKRLGRPVFNRGRTGAAKHNLPGSSNQASTRCVEGSPPILGLYSSMPIRSQADSGSGSRHQPEYGEDLWQAASRGNNSDSIA